MSAFTMKRHDTAPAIRIQLRDRRRRPVDLTEAESVMFHMKAVGASSTKVDRAATFVDRATGTVEYQWIGSDTDTAGEFHVEFEVTWSDDTKQTFPNKGFAVVEITEDLDNS